MAIAAGVVVGLGVVVAAIIGAASSSSTSDDQLGAAKEARELDLQLANQKRDDELKASREAMVFNRQELKQKKQLAMLQLGQEQQQFAQTQAQHELQNRLDYFNNMLAGNTQLKNNLAQLWRRK